MAERASAPKRLPLLRLRAGACSAILWSQAAAGELDERGLRWPDAAGADDILESVEVVHAFGAAAEFAGSLRTAQQERAEDGDFAAVEVKASCRRCSYFVTRLSAPRRAGQALFLQAREASRMASSSSFITGSRLYFWLHAFISALSESG